MYIHVYMIIHVLMDSHFWLVQDQFGSVDPTVLRFTSPSGEIDGLPNLKMVDLSIAMLVITRG